jgi:toxin CptA
MEMAARTDGFKYSGHAPANDPAWRVVISMGRSRRAEAWVVAVFTAGIVAVLFASLAPEFQALAAVALAAGALHALRRHGRQEGRGNIRGFVVDLAGNIEVDRADGSRTGGRILDGSFVAPWFVVVRWLPEVARFPRTILVIPDAVDADEFRRLRILLRWR